MLSYLLALTADAARADANICDALGDLDDEHAVLLMLLHCRHLGTASRWHPYIESLPLEDEIVPRLPAFWPAPLQNALLAGTPLLAQARANFQALRSFHETIIVDRLSTRFPAAAFSSRARAARGSGIAIEIK